MLEKLQALKENKKWLYYILFLPILVLSIYELYNKYLVNSSKTIIQNAEKKDDTLQKEQIKAEQTAAIHQEEANKIEDKINSTQVNKDWYLK